MFETALLKSLLNSRGVVVSLSGGRTSAYMLYFLSRICKNVTAVFMDTGLEHPKTYKFLRDIERYWGVRIVVIEAKVYHGTRKATGYQFKELKDCHGPNMRPSTEVCKKYGMFGMGFLHCTREMKLNPYKAWKKDHAKYAFTAVGVRVDEIDRMSDDAEKDNLIYPLVSWKITKEKILEFWENQPFDLEIPEYLGNCVACWKKSSKKLEAAKRDAPEYFEDIQQLEEYKRSPDQKMFRGRNDADDIGCKEECLVF